MRRHLTAAISLLACAAASAWPQPPQPTQPESPPPAATPEAAVPASAAAPRGTSDPSVRYRLDDQGRWVPETGGTPEAGSDAAMIAEARRALAEDRPAAARQVLDTYIERYERTENIYLPQAYLLRGDAISAGGNEYEALYDYEALIRQFPGTPEFVTGIERELEIGIRYCRGLYRKLLGVRMIDAADVGEELLIRVQERLPGSRLAERAGIELADHFYRTHDLKSAADAYELFGQNYPNSAYRMKAMMRRIYSKIGQYKGPRYDGSPLLDAQVLVRRFMAVYPAKSDEVGLDDSLLIRIDESQANQLLETASWYLKRGEPASCRYTLRRLIRQHPESAAAQRALEIMQNHGWITLNPPPPPAPAPTAEPSEPAAKPAPAAAAVPAAPAQLPAQPAAPTQPMQKMEPQ